MSDIHPFHSKESIENEARVWLVRLDGDAPLTKQESDELSAWCQRSPAHRRELQRISGFYNDANCLVDLAVPLKRQVAPKRQQFGGWSGLRDAVFSRYSFVSALFLVLAIGLFANRYLHIERLSSENGVYVTDVGEILKRDLADGSVLYVNTDSQVDIDYSSMVRKIRVIKGEAHFDVAKDPAWPFEVYAGKNMVKAVGTAFTVRVVEQGLDVTVTEGKVDLLHFPSGVTSKKDDSAKVGVDQDSNKVGSLTVGQRAFVADASLDAAHHDIEMMKVQPLSNTQLANSQAWQSGYLVFDGEPLSDVVAEIRRYTATKIEFEHPSLKGLRVGGRFRTNDIDALFEAMESSLGVNIAQLNDGHVLISQPESVR